MDKTAVAGGIEQIPEDYHSNEEGIPKAHLIRMARLYGLKPGVNLALFIAAGSLGRKVTWTNTDYAEHYIRVSGLGVRHSRISEDEIVTGILHDVVEDSDWDIEDLRDLGFSEVICNAVDSVTKRKPVPGQPKERYLDATKRASIDPVGRRVKMRDNDDNMDLTRGAFAAGDKQKFLYHISYTYLDAVDNHLITPNSSIWQFLKDPRFSKLVNKENIEIIGRNVSEPMPSYFIQKFNLAAQAATPIAPANN